MKKVKSNIYQIKELKIIQILHQALSKFSDLEYESLIIWLYKKFTWLQSILFPDFEIQVTSTSRMHFSHF